MSNKFFSYLRKLRYKTSGKKAVAVFFLLIFTISLFFFAKVEFIDNPARADIISSGANPYFETLYFIVTSMTTTGYGDYSPMTTAGKALAIVVMITGVSFLGFLLSNITKTIVSSNLGRLFGIASSSGPVDYIIAGWNDVSEAALKGIPEDKKVVIIDEQARPDIADKYGTVFIIGKTYEPMTLEKANIGRAKNILLAMEDDSEVLLSVHEVRELNPWINIIARIDNFNHIKLAEKAGADQVISPASITGRLLSIAAEEPFVVKWLLNSMTSASAEEFIEMLISEESYFYKKKVSEIKKEKHIKIIGVETSKGFHKVPSNDYTIEAGDKIILLLDSKIRGDLLD